MYILWLTWKDKEHPRSGGAEVVNEELATRLVRDGHHVTFLVGGWQGCERTVSRSGFTIIRLGNRVSVYVKAFFYYRKYLRNKFNVVIEEINTIPFFTKHYIRDTRRVLFIHQLAREIWFYEVPFPLSLIGYLVEPLYLRLLNDQSVITVSQSTTRDLLRYGFTSDRISLIPEGIALTPLPTLPSKPLDAPPFTLLYLGELRAMKRPDHIIRAFELIRSRAPSLKVREGGDEICNRIQLIIAGSSDTSYGKHILRIVQRSPWKDHMSVLGKISEAQKLALLRTSHLLCVTSLKEGWGLTVTESASQGTPAIVYDVDGLRDSVRNNETGIVCEENTSQCLAEHIMNLLSDSQEYERLRNNAWEWSKEFTFERSYHAFTKILPLDL